MALELLVDGVDHLDDVRAKTLQVKTTASGAQGILDCEFVDFFPTIGDSVVLQDGATVYYDGEVRSISTQEVKDILFVKVSCQDDALVGGVPDNAPFGLSDDPDDVDTFGYRKFSMQFVSAKGASNPQSDVSETGSLETFQPGLEVNTLIEITNANMGLEDQVFLIEDLTTTWPTYAAPLYTLKFGDVPISLVDTLVSQISGTSIDPASDLAQSLHAPHVVTSLPALPDADYPIGDLAYLTTDGKIYRNVDDAWSKALDGNDILVSSITAGAIQAGAIRAEALAAVIVLASIIKTAVSGARCELDLDGFRAYNASDVLAVNIPTDGSEVYVSGEIQALSLDIVGNAVIRGTENELAAGSVTYVSSYQGNPVLAPTLAQGWETVSLPVDATIESDYYLRRGLEYDAAGGAGGATKVFWTTSRFVNGTNGMYLLELLASDRTVNRSVELPFNKDIVGCARLGSYVYVLQYTDTDYDALQVNRYAVSDLSLNATYSPVNITGLTLAQMSHGICSDGTNLYIVAKDSGSASIKWNKYDAAMVKVGATIDTTYNSGVDDEIVDVAAGNFDFGAARIAIMSTKNDRVNTFTTAGVRQADELFPVSSVDSDGGLTYGDALADGARFWSFDGRYAGHTLTKHSTWVWTTASSIYWVAYSWYDSVGTVHESLVSPRASITMGRRKQLSITVPPLPGLAGADESDMHRLYMFPNATAPATTSLDLQHEMAEDEMTLVTYNNAGAAPAVTNGFESVATTAELRSRATIAEGGWSLRGDGTSGGFAAGRQVVAPFMDPTQEFATNTDLAAAGGVIAVPIAIYAPMYVSNLKFWNTNTSLARSAEARIYREPAAGGATLTAIAGLEFAFSFTPSAASMREDAPATDPTVLSPGQYFIVIRNTHASNVLGIGHAGTTATAFLGATNYASASGVSALSSTIDISGWSKGVRWWGVQLTGDAAGIDWS